MALEKIYKQHRFRDDEYSAQIIEAISENYTYVQLYVNFMGCRIHELLDAQLYSRAKAEAEGVIRAHKAERAQKEEATAMQAAKQWLRDNSEKHTGEGVVIDGEHIDEGGWVYLQDGYSWGGCHFVHERSWIDLFKALQRVVPCESDCECHEN